WFDLTTLRAGTWVLAQNYGFRFRGSWFWYQPTIVNKFEELSPGYCLLAKIVEDAARDPESRVVDLGLGEEEYKDRFANAQRTTLYATLSHSRIDLWKAKGRYYCAEAIKRRPRLESVARRVQTAVRAGRTHLREKGWQGGMAEGYRRLQRSIVS